MQTYGAFMKTRFHELAHKSKMRLLKPTPAPLNGKATQPAKYVNKMEGRPSPKGQEEIVNESHRRVTRNGGGGKENAWKSEK